MTSWDYDVFAEVRVGVHKDLKANTGFRDLNVSWQKRDVTRLPFAPSSWLPRSRVTIVHLLMSYLSLFMGFQVVCILISIFMLDPLFY